MSPGWAFTILFKTFLISFICGSLILICLVLVIVPSHNVFVIVAFVIFLQNWWTCGGNAPPVQTTFNRGLYVRSQFSITDKCGEGVRTINFPLPCAPPLVFPSVSLVLLDHDISRRLISGEPAGWLGSEGDFLADTTKERNFLNGVASEINLDDIEVGS